MLQQPGKQSFTSIVTSFERKPILTLLSSASLNISAYCTYEGWPSKSWTVLAVCKLFNAQSSNLQVYYVHMFWACKQNFRKIHPRINSHGTQYKTASHADPAHADDVVYCYASTSCTTCNYRLLFIEVRSVVCDTQAMFVPTFETCH